MKSQRLKAGYVVFRILLQKIEGVAEGFLARIIQHEINHLYGILFTDVCKDYYVTC